MNNVDRDAIDRDNSHNNTSSLINVKTELSESICNTTNDHHPEESNIGTLYNSGSSCLFVKTELPFSVIMNDDPEETIIDGSGTTFVFDNSHNGGNIDNNNNSGFDDTDENMDDTTAGHPSSNARVDDTQSSVIKHRNDSTFYVFNIITEPDNEVDVDIDVNANIVIDTPPTDSQSAVSGHDRMKSEPEQVRVYLQALI